MLMLTETLLGIDGVQLHEAVRAARRDGPAVGREAHGPDPLAVSVNFGPGLRVVAAPEIEHAHGAVIQCERE
jgi:hypothetical protein